MSYSIYTTYDSPVPHRNIKIYPVLVKDYVLFQYYSTCLLQDKNSIPDAKIISMTYLEYLFYETAKDESKPFLFLFDRLLALCLRDDESFQNTEESLARYRIDENEKPMFIINDEIYTSSDFEIIKAIICEQNLLELPDEDIQKEVRDSLEKAREYKNKLSGTKSGTFEDYIISLAVTTGWSFEYIYNMTIRRFTKSVQRLDNLIHYKVYLGASLSGMVEFKDKSFIKHWLSNLDSDEKFSDVKVDVDAVEDKINFESAKR